MKVIIEETIQAYTNDRAILGNTKQDNNILLIFLTNKERLILTWEYALMRKKM